MLIHRKPAAWVGLYAGLLVAIVLDVSMWHDMLGDRWMLLVLDLIILAVAWFVRVPLGRFAIATSTRMVRLLAAFSQRV